MNNRKIAQYATPLLYIAGLLLTAKTIISMNIDTMSEKASMLDMAKLLTSEEAGELGNLLDSLGYLFGSSALDSVVRTVQMIAICMVIFVVLMIAGIIISVVAAIKGRRKGLDVALIAIAAVSAIDYVSVYSRINYIIDTLDSYLSMLSAWGVSASIKIHVSTLVLELIILILIIVIPLIFSDRRMAVNIPQLGGVLQKAKYLGENVSAKPHRDAPEQFESEPEPQVSDVMFTPQELGLAAPDASVQIDENFFGAIIGMNGRYEGYGYELGHKQQVYFEYKEDMLWLTTEKSESSILGIYFVEEYQEYCLDIYEKKEVYLKNGVPMGMGRSYYLPRGKEIYIKSTDYTYMLA